MTEDSTPRPDAERPPVDPGHTQEVDVEHTRAFGPPPGQAPLLPPQEPVREPVWASGPDYTAAPSQAMSGPKPWSAGEHPAYANNPYSATATQSVPAKQATKGPSWLAVFLIAGLAALLAGLTGGLFGGWLGATDRFDGLDLRSGQDAGATPQPGAGATTRPGGTVANIAANATPSVVTIQVQAADGDGTGSGWVLDDKGHIVTNNHVVASAASGGEITVVLSNGKESKATIVGRDVSYDLAVLKVDRTDLTPLPIGDSNAVVVGDPVIAVGAPLGLDSTVTTGIVSALNRPVTPGNADDQSFINAIQTDAAINPGNSGGPLLDMQGRVIGINTAIARVAGQSIGGQSGNIGVGFAIPSAQVKITVDQLIRTGKAEHPIIGVMLDRQYQGEGIRIAEDSADNPAVTPDGPAAKAGLRAGDVITAFEGRPMTDPDALVVAIRSKAVGSTVTLTVVRDGKSRDVKMVLQGRSD
ncbi:serine protease [Knoellia sinensis KCTC 19936]|uniref:Serine protease n=1 Tax=Knoellia sinensis KCTC 19936 TaxID=1385520 RepID=A0A0A0JCB7_9MICO|nr:trypsin-like peptidase domain-containing protein [Knoellia sinensis]KGN33652.1 serine protease [Knoellia sinensis KCTC 19936]